jgi:hypothetical protein
MTDDGLVDAFRSVKTAVDDLWVALQSWADERRVSGSTVPSPMDIGADSASTGVPAQRGKTPIPVPEPSS